MAYNTDKKYSFLWSRYTNVEPPKRYHFDSMQEVLPENIVRGSIGLDLGCGSGVDTFIMAKHNPALRIIGMDISQGVYQAYTLNQPLKNTIIIRGTASRIPLKDDVCDFVYSFGVLHHMSDYKKGLLEILRVLKKESPTFLYLYEDHAENIVKYISIKLINIIRRITVRIPPRVLYVLSYIASPIMVLLFSYPARIFKRYRATYKLYEKMPFNFGSSLCSLTGDLYDRFATPIEIRFNRESLRKILKECNFSNIRITKLKARAGWVVSAYKI